MPRNNSFFDDLRNEAITGVAYKNLSLKKQILIRFANTGNATIADLSKELNISTPKTAGLVTELLQDGLVKDYGKTESSIGRRPSLYGLNPHSVFFVGVEVKRFHVNIGLLDFKKNVVKISESIPYRLDNTPEAFRQLCDIIQDFIRILSIKKDKILGIGLNLSGRINSRTGYSYSYFHFGEEPLSNLLEKETGIPVFLENDSRAMAYGEFCHGAVRDEKHILFINMDYGIGMGIMVNGRLYYGRSGFAGELGHIPVFDNEIICHCGKKGCLETEASGEALIRIFLKRIRGGASSIAWKPGRKETAIQLEDIIRAAKQDDVLAIECIAEIGEKLGKGMATLINLYNPELVILGGSLSATGAYIQLPIITAVHKYSLSLVNNDTELKISQLGERAGVIGACLLVRDRLLGLL
ncbi:ROK family protein [Compostibacter hankyongensis]|uniref:ROK family transcriptional regulator n=1 Tax=Compostibacter hankyongensis TaxID=1007089 RepID=A0ABP8GA87_9BACT